MNGEIRLVPPLSWRRDGRGALLAAILHGGVLGLMMAGFLIHPPKTPPMAVSSMVVELVPLAVPQPQPAPAPLPVAPPAPPTGPLAPAKPLVPKTIAAPKPKSPAPRPAAKPQAVETSSPASSEAPPSGASSNADVPAGSTEAAAAAPSFVPPRSDVAGLDNPRPPYPTLARRRGWEGLVILMVMVNEAGMAQSVTLHRSSGHDILDQSALDTVKSWRFVPARQGGHTVPASVQVPIRFTLDGKA
ncbi:MAG: energy transducer TonB [Magnetospirillum sp.]